MSKICGAIARENFSLLEKICEMDIMKNVLLVTTMWEHIEANVGRARKQELSTNPLFFRNAIEHGAALVRHYNRPESAKRIISRILDKYQGRQLWMQRELVDDHKQVPETEAGKT